MAALSDWRPGRLSDIEANNTETDIDLRRTRPDRRGLRESRGRDFTQAQGQRVWSRQPEGGLIGLGASPLRIIRCRAAAGSGTGTAEGSASV